MAKNTLKIEGLHAKIAEKEILKGINLSISSGEIHAIMGQNGSGKSTLCNVLVGNPKYSVLSGKIKFNNKAILGLEANKTANLGIFLAFQNPTEVPGVSFGNFLRMAKNAQLKAINKKTQLIGPLEFSKIMEEKCALLNIDKSFTERSLNEGFSGGEKKKAEILQMAILEPKIVILDEIDSGLDIDGLRNIAENIKTIFKKTNMGLLIITHYQRILNYITPNFVHIMADGKIVKSGNKNLALELEKSGYKSLIQTT